jgi:hypothetical protein
MFGWLRSKSASKDVALVKSDAVPGTLTLGQVFVPGGKPTITYVPRSKLGLEDTVRDHIRETREILLLIGPTKSGKTVLTQTVIPDDRRITIEGNRVQDREDRFWNDVAAKAGAAHTVVSSDTNQTKTHSIHKAGISINTEHGLGKLLADALPLPSIELGTKHETTEQRVADVKRHLVTDPQEEAINLLIASKKVLVIEDFHVVAPQVQRNVVRALKGAVFEGMRVIVLGIPHRENDVVAGMIDMQGRTRKLEMPMWSKEDLREICDKGFKALNVQPAANVVTQFCTHAFGSPNLLQKFCLRLCQKHGITERQDKPVKVSLGQRYETFFEEFVAQESNQDVTRIVADFRSPNENGLKRFATKKGEEMNIYQLVLLAISHKLPATSIAAGDIGSTIEELVAGDAPKTDQITKAIQRLGSLAKEISDELRIGQPVLEYDAKLRKLHITDASFAFHVKWGRI